MKTGTVMNIEETVRFLTEQRAKSEAAFAAWQVRLDADRKRSERRRRAIERLIRRIRRTTQLEVERHHRSLEAQEERQKVREREFSALLNRFDALLRNRQDGEPI
jgi:hypothetical protein